MQLLAGAVVTQKMIQLGDCVVEIVVVPSVDYVDVLTRVSMEQTQTAFHRGIWPPNSGSLGYL